MSCPTQNDERNHKPSDRKDWRESYYFNFVDTERGVYGFTTIGLLPQAAKREFVFALFHRDKRHFYYQEPAAPYSFDSFESLNDGHLRFELIEAMKQWRITISSGELKADLNWVGRFPPFNFGECSGTSWDGHFEQSGVVTGTLQMGDMTLSINGFGQRDKSWGSRNWHIDQWYALHAQFREFSIGLRNDIVGENSIVSGGVSSISGCVPITRVDVETEYGTDPNQPIGATTKIGCKDGREYVLNSKLISPLSFVKFTRRFPGGTTELLEAMALHRWEETEEIGTGLLEWLFTRMSGPLQRPSQAPHQQSPESQT
jgi:hypothetical protein